ncbi:bifunctional diaminohydroxyphosphoribosylaminopyrimidine deaminase/5-amino-6-(5-phosphoribosylamino)uracil reductase RibD [Kordiimonas aestuarii]|uniref:bifunctional diaminohydroxyphosphoribosylaminopyrimidine deaminase/5-amino-6-(5-phosphoribosylamino)uracil reductase RibD n=1 Tax=Kordiimonas aestuarii TaxID=1005925 RepID=UPI0021D3B668|nr:bifunctional diaminohydroxyphosphoribosylaminopyrimidine deaminase/5-amino-6-(5-phosphoribosylamino)uracil reductase RibD [Kordiimonas aestuarii]
MATTREDEKHMKIALGLARRGLGMVAPNPAVGCVIVKDNLIVGQGFTQRGGRPHAETVALAQAGDRALGATAYVTLEPCSHTGHTGPCAQALITAGISRAVCATGDPDPRVSGRGFDMLRAAGIRVDVGAGQVEAARINAGFFLKVREGRPLFTLKMASSMDGRIALANGESKWITGPEARACGHLLRAQHDAILIGVGTALADDPALDCRLPGLEDRSPTRIVLDRRLRISADSTLVETARNIPTLVLCQSADAQKQQRLESAGVEVMQLNDLSDMMSVATALGERGLTRVLVEGGGQVHASFLKSGLADRVEHFTAPKLIGGDGKAMTADLGLASLGDALHLTCKSIRPLGADMLASYEKPE